MVIASRPWILAGLCLAITACTNGEVPPGSPALARPATIKDIMDSMVDPSGDFLFESVVQIADENGIREIAPQTDEEWEEVRHHALVLLEAPNLLVMDGRKVARSGEKAENPDVELQPEEIQAMIDGDRAEALAVVATTDDGAGVFVVPSGSVASTRQPTFDGSFHLAAVRLDDVRVADDREFTGPDVAAGVERARQEAAAGLAAVMVGASQRVLETVLGHVKQRKQFGVPIGSFQAVKHMAVDMFVAIERARALCHFAGLTLAEDDDRRSLAASLAKAAAGDCQRSVGVRGAHAADFIVDGLVP